jgi:hypothetical protein
VANSFFKRLKSYNNNLNRRRTKIHDHSLSEKRGQGNIMVNYKCALDRIKEIAGFDKDSEVAELFDLSAPDFAKRKKKGTQ